MWRVAHVFRLYGKLRVRWGEDTVLGHPIGAFPRGDEWRGPLDPEDVVLLTAVRALLASPNSRSSPSDSLASLRKILALPNQ